MINESRDFSTEQENASREASKVDFLKKDTNGESVETTDGKGLERRPRTRTRIPIQNNTPTFALREDKEGEPFVRGGISSEEAVQNTPFPPISNTPTEPKKAPIFSHPALLQEDIPTKGIADNMGHLSPEEEDLLKKLLEKKAQSQRERYSSATGPTRRTVHANHGENLQHPHAAHDNRAPRAYGNREPRAHHGYREPRAYENRDARAYTKNNKNKKNHPKQKEQHKVLPRPSFVPTYPDEKEGSDAPIRLNKYLAHAGVGSRRIADELIAAGKVKVNGQVVSTLGTTVTYKDTIEYNGKVISIEPRIYVLLNKPKNFLTTVEDPQNRKTVMHLVKNACNERIYPVGRLDRNTTGVLLLTNDGDLMGKLLHPSFNKKKIYQVTLNKPVAPEHMQQIIDGIELSDGEIHADVVSYVDENDLSIVGIELHSGRNRIVRRIFEYFGYTILKLDRVYFAGLTKKNLPRGHWRYLTEEEVNRLRQGNYE